MDEDDHASPTSAARSFALTAPPTPTSAAVALQAPAQGEVHTRRPGLSLDAVAGRQHYQLKVSRYSDFHTLYDAVISAYPAYSPYTPGGLKKQYENGLYYWKVEARNSSGSVITTSPVYSFTKQSFIRLMGPEDGSVLATDPSFEWAAGARRCPL